MDLLDQVWERLKQVDQFRVRATSKKPFLQRHEGRGTLVIVEEEKSLVFNEKGAWDNPSLSFTNLLRWTKEETSFSLEHLRYGNGNPVVLFSLQKVGDKLISAKPHLCGSDCYQGEMMIGHDALHLFYQVKGPKKEIEIHIDYV